MWRYFPLTEQKLKVYYVIFAKCPSGFFEQPDNQYDQRQQQNQYKDYGISFFKQTQKQSRYALNLCLISIMSAEDPMAIGK